MSAKDPTPTSTGSAVPDHASEILATLRHGFLVLDADLRVVTANRAFYKAFQVTHAETEGRYVYDLGDGQWNIPRLRELLEEILPQHHSFDDFGVDHDFPGGVGRKCMAINARRVRQPDNRSDLILMGIEDITERRTAEEILRDAEVRYRRLFQTAKDGILILDAHSGKIIDANAFMEGLVGLEAGQLLGKELHEIGMFKDIEENKAAFRELQKNRYIRYEHLPVQNQRGETVEVEFIANVYHEDHRLVAQCNVRDISARVRMEKMIAQQAAALADESRRKDEFLAMLSHELRNPLAPIRSAVHLLKLEDHAATNPIQRQALEIIDRQVGNLTKLVSDLLEVSRVANGRIRLNMQKVDMNQVVQQAIQTVTPLIEHHKHTLTLNLCPHPAWATADALRMEEVFINLLNNAAKYTPDGGRIGVDFEQHQNHVLIQVHDNGIGISAELLPRIFDLFTQADRSLDRSQGGLGIGLSLAHRLVDLQGGTIEAKSDGPGKGSKFIVRLPLKTAPDLEVVGPEANVVPVSAGVRVLVVDDNIDLVTMLTGALKHKGYIVQNAYTGPDGLRIAQQWRPDIVLLDIGLPGLDGFEVARRLRSDGGADARLIALTGYGQDTDIALTREAGFDAHMVKPYDFDELEKLMVIQK